MQDKRATQHPAAVRRERAHGRKISLSLGLLGGIVLYVAWVLLTPALTAYELKGAMRPVCLTFMNAQMYKSSDRSLDWQREWSKRYRALGIPLRDDQWQFTASNLCDPKKGCTCTGEAVFELTTPWFLLSDFIDIAPYKSTHHVKQNVEWKTSY